MKVVDAESYSWSNSLEGDLLCILTAGIANLREVLEYTCGHCKVGHTTKVYEDRRHVKCPTCGTTNRIRDYWGNK